jgi:hypothetical protein
LGSGLLQRVLLLLLCQSPHKQQQQLLLLLLLLLLELGLRLVWTVSSRPLAAAVAAMVRALLCVSLS